MGKYCEVCGKGTLNGHSVSPFHRKPNRIWATNVQNVRCVVNGTAKRMNVCTSCLRSGNVTRALPRTRMEA